MNTVDLGKMTQVERVIWYMENRGAITPKDAEDELGIMRLAAVIHTVKKLGYAICTEYVNVKDRWGAKRTVASYSLVRQAVSA